MKLEHPEKFRSARHGLKFRRRQGAKLDQEHTVNDHCNHHRKHRRKRIALYREMHKLIGAKREESHHCRSDHRDHNGLFSSPAGNREDSGWISHSSGT